MNSYIAEARVESIIDHDHWFVGAETLYNTRHQLSDEYITKFFERVEARIAEDDLNEVLNALYWGQVLNHINKTYRNIGLDATRLEELNCYLKLKGSDHEWSND